MNILVIGGKGFTGTCLVPLLKHRNPGGAVAVASRSSDTVRMDLSDAESVSRLLREKQWDQVVCLAACVRSPDREDFVQTNIRGIENLIRGLRDSPFTGRLLVVGSSAVYGELPPWDSSASGDQESHAATHPVSAYGETLLERESVVREGTNNQPFSSVITRTFNLIGPGLPDPFAFARFAKRTHRLLRGEVNAVEVGPLDAIRDFVDVRDACRGYQDLLDMPMEPGETCTVNLSSGLGRPIGDFFPVIEHQVGRPIPTRINPDWVNPREVSAQVGDPARMHRLTGWSPQIPFEQSIIDLFLDRSQAD